MFSSSTYAARRHRLIEDARPAEGLVLLLGNEQSPMNYADNPYPFRQDSTFLYYVGIDAPSLDATIDLNAGAVTLYGDDPDLDDVIWMGERPSVADYAAQAGIETVRSRSALHDDLASALKAGRSIHVLPPYRENHRRRLEALLGIRANRLDAYTSISLIRAVVRHRSTKSHEEVEQLERALETTGRLHEHAMAHAAPGTTEQTLVGSLRGIAEREGKGLSFPPTCSVRGEVLHNHVYKNTLEANDLLLVDAGAASDMHYAGDITRVTPVGGSFTSRQRDVYEAVLDAQTAAIEACTPGVPFREVHLTACRVLTRHLIDIGLMQGSAEEAVAQGDHALFFPHGLGHMLGLDAHDMENLGEQYVGYAEDQERSSQFGLNALRLARPLQPGFVVTVEPGCYFIPELIRRWREEDRHAQINYDVVEEFVGMGGVRIEDDVLITEDGPKVLGPSIPKAVDDVEQLAGTAADTV